MSATHTPSSDAASDDWADLPRITAALDLRDLTDPQAGPHAVQHLVDAATSALARRWRCEVVVHRDRPIVSVEDNYDRLGYPPEATARDRRYTRYVSDTCLLRTHTSAMVPVALRRLAATEPVPPADVLVACPGMVHRRDVIDRLHVGTPHQVDLWRVRRGDPLTTADLEAMIATVVRAVLPHVEWRTEARVHPYTTDGLQIDVLADDGTWVEIGECGMADPAVLERAGIDPGEWTGLAMGLGLDRLLMLRKGVPDIRLLRSDDSRVAAQMLHLGPWESVSDQPPIVRDVSVAVDPALDAELLGDRVREALGADARSVEAVEVLSETPGDDVPVPARARLGLRDGQKNVLVRVVLRHPERTLTRSEANELRDRVHAALHEGG
ncbi:MAG: hypothetical protein S0880_23780 [Actinomycetota bacterium]|nr:hypothetical protein [Actinomycetota bacterium]